MTERHGSAPAPAAPDGRRPDPTERHGSAPARPGAPLSATESASLFAIYRALGRSLQLGGTRGGLRGWRRPVLACAVVLDAVIWRAIRDGSVPFPLRVGVDMADLALWAGPGGSDLMSALSNHPPLDVEAGIRWGGWGFAVPAIAASVSSAARTIFGRRPEPWEHISHAGAVIGGIAVRRGERSRMARAGALHEAELSAKTVRAFLAGQNDVTMGASSIIDQLKPVAILLEADTPGSVLNQVRADWKQSLAEQAQQHAVFLDSAVRLWQQAHNEHPDLRGFVEVVQLAEGDGTTLITGHQARALAELLEREELRGEVHVRVARQRDRRPGRPGRELALSVGDRTVVIPADPNVTIDRFNPAPPALFFGAWAALMPTRRQDGGLPLGVGLSCSAAFLLAGLRHLDRRRRAGTVDGGADDGAVEAALWTGIALAALQGAACDRWCRIRRTSTGAHLYHGTYGIAPAGLLLAASRTHLSRRHHRSALTALGAVAALAYVAAERPRSAVDFALVLGHPAAATAGMHVVATAAARETSRMSARLREQDDDAEAAAFEEGRRHVLALAAAAIAEADAAFAQAGHIDPGVRRSIAARLEAIKATAASISGDGRAISVLESRGGGRVDSVPATTTASRRGSRGNGDGKNEARM